MTGPLKEKSLGDRLRQLEEGRFPEHLSLIDLLRWQIEVWAYPSCWVANSKNEEVIKLQEQNRDEAAKALMILKKMENKNDR